MPAPLLRILLVALLVPASLAWGYDVSPPAPVAFHSSIAAVLSKRGALELTPEQVSQLEAADARLMRDQDALRREALHPVEGAAPGSPGGGGSGYRGPSPGGAPSGMSGGKSRPPPTVPSSRDAAAALQQQLDGLDTGALLAAVEGFPEPQRERAIAVAEKYREQLYDQRVREGSAR